MSWPSGVTCELNFIYRDMYKWEWLVIGPYLGRQGGEVTCGNKEGAMKKMIVAAIQERRQFTLKGKGINEQP